MSNTIELYDEAIAVAEEWRLGNNRFKVQSATPNEIHLYNVFTSAKRQLEAHKACIEDAQGTYTVRANDIKQERNNLKSEEK